MGTVEIIVSFYPFQVTMSDSEQEQHPEHHAPARSRRGRPPVPEIGPIIEETQASLLHGIITGNEAAVAAVTESINSGSLGEAVINTVGDLATIAIRRSGLPALEAIISQFAGQGWAEEGLAIRLANLAGFAEGNARAVVAFGRMLGNFAFGGFEAGLENAIELFGELDGDSQEGFLASLRDLGSQSGNAALEALLDDFANYLSARANGDQTTLREYLRARGTENLADFIGEGWGAPTINAIETAYDYSTNPIGSLLGGITSLVQQATAEEDADEDDDAEENTHHLDLSHIGRRPRRRTRRRSRRRSRRRTRGRTRGRSGIRTLRRTVRKTHHWRTMETTSDSL